jgi:putative flippase GtrA
VPKLQLRNKAEKLRFALVGGLNTAIDFAVFTALNAAGMSSIGANYISTTTALLFSFAANRKFTFQATDGSGKRQFVTFLAVTLAGLWVLQPLVIAGTTAVVGSGPSKSHILVDLLGKALATCTTLAWNYLWYSRYVFKRAN